MAIEQAAEGLAAGLDVPPLVRSLRDILGPSLVAVVAGTTEGKDVAAWAWGERSPRPDAERRLGDAFRVTQLLLTHESSETVRAWFVGMNPGLDDRAPALVIAEDPDAVLLAARSLLANG